MNSYFEKLAQKHYENFPVGSRFILKKYRRAIHSIYAFARVADDIADEGTMAPTERIAKLDEWERFLENALNGESRNALFNNLASIIRSHNLSPHYFKELLVAFRRDSSNPSYHTYEDLLGYCKFSANPIGRLLLQVFECSSERNVEYSDSICTALQLTNFWQDISIDTRRNRIYIPIDEMRDFGVHADDLLCGNENSSFCALMKHEVLRTKALFHSGKPLIDLVAKDFRFELALIWHGGMRILEKIEAQQYDTRRSRPVLNNIDKAKIFLRAILH